MVLGVVLIASGGIQHKTTSIMAGFWVASPVVATSQSGSFAKQKIIASSPTFSPPGQTTHFPHCSSFHACSWWRKLQGFLWGLPSIRTLRCALLDSGVCRTASFMWMKVYGQSGPLLASKTRHWATSNRDTRRTWQGCTHTATRLKILSHPAVRLGAIKRKAISFLGFSAFSQASAWERVVNWACLMVSTLNHQTGRQKLRDPHMVMEVGSHSAVSAHKCKKMLTGVVICGYSCLQLGEKKSTN